jgi:hypothetical protein
LSKISIGEEQNLDWRLEQFFFVPKFYIVR